jgi:hypothetical protein
MRQREPLIETRLAEAISAAAGAARPTSPATRLEAALGAWGEESASVSGGQPVLSSGSPILEALTTAFLPEMSAGESRAGIVQPVKNLLPYPLADLLAQRPASTGSSWTGLVSQLNPILGGILRIFGGSTNGERPPLQLAAKPTTAHLELGIRNGDGGYYLIDREESGLPRANKPLGTPAVVVQVEAMDSRSFLDRTPEIAEAVQRALLESEGMQRLLATWRD